MKKLTERQARFVREYLVDGDAGNAAVRAGYSGARAGATAAWLLQQEHVRAALEESGAVPQTERPAAVPARAGGAQEGGGNRSSGAERGVMEVLHDIQALTREAWEAGDLRMVLKCLELESKHLGLVKDRTETDLSGGICISWKE